MPKRRSNTHAEETPGDYANTLKDQLRRWKDHQAELKRLRDEAKVPRG